jgi:phenylpyruvate tautomerase PptA (4-oxalocrotonate tautomerase family)
LVGEGSKHDGQKAAIVEALIRIHNEETGARRYLVQVVIKEKKATDRFLGSSLRPDRFGSGAIAGPAGPKRSGTR